MKISSMKFIAVAAVFGVFTSGIRADIDMTKFRDAMQKTQNSIRGIGELMKTVPPLVRDVKVSIDQMKREVEAFKAAGKPSEKIIKINVMNQLIIQDLKLLAGFIQNIGQLVIAPIDAQPAEQTEEVAQIMQQIIGLIEQVNSMLGDISQAVAVFEA